MVKSDSPQWSNLFFCIHFYFIFFWSVCVSVEVALEEQPPEQAASVSDADIASAINGILKAAEDHAVVRDSGAGIVGQGSAGATPSGRKWSSVWTHYERLEEQNRALCLICNEKIQHQSSTSNLLRHLSKRHPEAFARLEGHIKKQKTSVVQKTLRRDGDPGPKHTNLSRRIGEVALKQSPWKFPGRSDICEYRCCSN